MSNFSSNKTGRSYLRSITKNLICNLLCISESLSTRECIVAAHLEIGMDQIYTLVCSVELRLGFHTTKPASQPALLNLNEKSNNIGVCIIALTHIRPLLRQELKGLGQI